MSYPLSFLYDFLPLEILLLGIILIIILGSFSSKIIRKFPFLMTRMRIVYGYIALISSIIAVIVYSYLYTPLDSNYVIAFDLTITAFTSGLFYAVSFAIIIGIFLSIVEIKLKFRKSYMLFVSLLLIESSTIFITAANSLVFIFFGFVLIFTGMNFFIRNFTTKMPDKKKSFIGNYLTLSSLALSLLFIGFAAHSLSGNSFILSIENTTLRLWELISEIFILSGLLVLVGGPPFHFIFFESENEKFNAITQIMISVQKGLTLAFLIKYTLTIAESSFSIVLIWLFTVCGVVYVLWGVLASMTVKRLQKLVHYISIIFVGIILLILSDLFSPLLTEELINLTLKTAFYGVLVFILSLTFSISSIGVISKGFKSDEIRILREVGRNSISQFVIMVLNVLLMFAAPSSILLVSQKIVFPDYFSPRMYVTAVILLLGVVFSLVYLIRLLRSIFFIPVLRSQEFSSPEPAVFIGSFIALILIVAVVIFIKQFLIFCSLFGINLV